MSEINIIYFILNLFFFFVPASKIVVIIIIILNINNVIMTIWRPLFLIL